MPKIRRIDIPQQVRVRKYEVDCVRLCSLLREHKRLTGKSNKHLAVALNLPLTQVEHWFRTDSCFAIPGEDIWEALKEELSITTTEFDKSILTFEERPGVYEKSERCYLVDGIAPTLTSTSAGNEKIIVEGRRMHIIFDDYNQRVRADQKTIGTLTTNIGSPTPRNGYKIIETSQNVSDEKTNDIRIRKLTPKECFRLMGFCDADFEKASSVNSNTQLYKQAGNSIGVPVLEHIMTALFQCGALVK